MAGKPERFGRHFSLWRRRSTPRPIARAGVPRGGRRPSPARTPTRSATVAVSESMNPRAGRRGVCEGIDGADIGIVNEVAE